MSGNSTILNAAGKCLVSTDWQEFKRDAEESMAKIETMHNVIHGISEHTKHLGKLDAVALILAAHLATLVLFGGIFLVIVLNGSGMGANIKTPVGQIDIQRH